jgi:GLPGLI family protein
MNCKRLLILSISLLFNLTILSAQVKSGEVLYIIEVNNSSIKFTDDFNYKAFRTKLFEISKTIKFKLEFNQNESFFSMIEKTTNDNNSLNFRSAVRILRGKSNFYFNLKEKTLIEQKNYLGEDFRFRKQIENLNWRLINERKQIGDYTCFKAVGVKYGKDRNHKTTETPIIAWYCPELPYTFGPFESVGLPGLVLQYELGNFIWKASTFNFHDTLLEIKRPKKGKLTTEEELNNLVKGKL